MAFLGVSAGAHMRDKLFSQKLDGRLGLARHSSGMHVRVEFDSRRIVTRSSPPFLSTRIQV